MNILRWSFLSLLLTMAACAWWMAGRRGPPERITFSHALHKEQGATCEQCHQGVSASTEAAQRFMPAQQTCMECHDESCGACMKVGARYELALDIETLAFSHATHLPRVEGDCKRCHANAESATTLPVDMPAMALCLTCHEHAAEYEASRCTRCHPSLQRLPLQAVAEFNHAGNWIERHGMLSRSDGASCLQCHPQTSCSECHSELQPAAPARLYPEQVERTLLHRGDFLSTHMIEARADGDTCLRCHSTNYCEECHRASGVAGRDGRSPHPPGWITRSGSAFHGTAARRNIETCVACHDQGAQSNCVDCHRVGQFGGNPHPAGWNDKYDLDDVRGNAVCRACHI